LAVSVVISRLIDTRTPLLYWNVELLQFIEDIPDGNLLKNLTWLVDAEKFNTNPPPKIRRKTMMEAFELVPNSPLYKWELGIVN
jgi:hypothetical protein